MTNVIDTCAMPGVYVYSCVTDDYDIILPPVPLRKSEIQFVLFCASQNSCKGWHSVPCVRQLKSGILTNRFHKFFPHLLFPNAEYSIYVDGNIGIIGDILVLLDQFIESGAAIGLFRHRDRATVAQEMIACLDMEKFDKDDRLRYEMQVNNMYLEGMPESQTLTDNAVIFRRHKHPSLAVAMDDWWAQLHTYTKRDQVSLPYVLWKNNVPTKIWNWNFRERNAYFEKYPHKGKVSRNVRIRLKNIVSKTRFRW